MEKLNYFQRCWRRTRLKFLVGLSLIVLMALGISLQLRGLASWGGVAFLALVVPGVSLTISGLRIYPIVRRSQAVLTADFPAGFQHRELLRDHDLEIPPIGVLIRGDHLFILHRSWFALINLQTVKGLSVGSASTRIQAWDELVIDTLAGNRFHWMLPRPTRQSDGIDSSQAAETGLQILFVYLRETFPHIRLGRSRNTDPRSGDPENIRDRSDPDRWEEFNRSWYGSDE